MPSECIVPVVAITAVKAHPNADALDLVEVLGYQMVVRRGSVKPGEKMVYFPADTLIPAEWADKFGVRNYLHGSAKDRVKPTKLRGEPSFGLVVPLPEGQDWPVDYNARDFYGAKKYEPPVVAAGADMAYYDPEIDPFFHKYTDIENGRLLLGEFIEGEEVVVTEKIHGRNARVGLIGGKVIVGSHTTRKKPPEDGNARENLDWYPTTLSGVQQLLEHLAPRGVPILFGETYGGSVQSLDYGIPKRKGLGFRAFDISVNGVYLGAAEFEELCNRFNIDVVPKLYQGPFSITMVKELAEGNTTVSGAGGKHIREGAVVKPVAERHSPKIGRVILKFISTAYDLSKHKEQDSTDV